MKKTFRNRSNPQDTCVPGPFNTRVLTLVPTLHQFFLDARVWTPVPSLHQFFLDARAELLGPPPSSGAGIPPPVLLLFLLANVSLNCLNTYWFSLMVRGAVLAAGGRSMADAGRAKSD